MYTNIKYIYIAQSYSKTRKKMCVKTTLSVNLTDTVGKGLIEQKVIALCILDKGHRAENLQKE